MAWVGLLGGEFLFLYFLPFLSYSSTSFCWVSCEIKKSAGFFFCVLFAVRFGLWLGLVRVGDMYIS